MICYYSNCGLDMWTINGGKTSCTMHILHLAIACSEYCRSYVQLCTLYSDDNYAHIHFIVTHRCLLKVKTSATFHHQGLNQRTLVKVSIEPCICTLAMVVYYV